jgi:hypothetical protein
MVSMIITATYTFALEKLSSGLQLIHIYKWAYTFATIVAIAVHIAFNGIAMPALHTDTLLVVYIIYVCAVATPLSLVLHFVAKKRLTTKTLNTYSFSPRLNSKTSLLQAYHTRASRINWTGVVSHVSVF